MSDPGAGPAKDWNKAYGAAGSALFGVVLGKVIVGLINRKYPGFLDPTLADGIESLFACGPAGFGAWLAPQRKG